MSNTAALEELARVSFANQIRGTWTSIPCVVVAVTENLNKQQVDVQPLINQFNRNGQFAERPPIYGVPVVFPASRTSAFTFPVQVDDVVLCVFSMRGLEAFKQSDGKPRNPLDFSDYADKDAIAIPGLFPFDLAVNNPDKRTLPHSTSDAVLTHNIGTANECEIRFIDDGNIKITTPNNITVECDTANVNATGDVDVQVGGNATIDISGDAGITVGGTTQLDSTGDVDITCPTANVNATNTNLGSGGAAIARLGDAVQVIVSSGSSAGTWPGTIIAASPNNTST